MSLPNRRLRRQLHHKPKLNGAVGKPIPKRSDDDIFQYSAKSIFDALTEHRKEHGEKDLELVTLQCAIAQYTRWLISMGFLPAPHETMDNLLQLVSAGAMAAKDKIASQRIITLS